MNGNKVDSKIQENFSTDVTCFLKTVKNTNNNSTRFDKTITCQTTRV